MKVYDLYSKDFSKHDNIVLVGKGGFKRMCQAQVCKNGIRWRCIRKRQGCRAYVITDPKIQNIIAQGYSKHTCRMTKKDKIRKSESRERVDQFLRNLGYDRKRTSKYIFSIKDFTLPSNQMQPPTNVSIKKVSIKTTPMKSPEDPKEYINQYFKSDAHLSLEERQAHSQVFSQPQDQNAIKVQYGIQQQQHQVINSFVGSGMRSVMTIPKIGQTESTFITDYFQRREPSENDKQSTTKETQTDSAVAQLSKSTLIFIRNSMNNNLS